MHNIGFFVTFKMISISTSQTFLSWVIIFHHRRPMVCLSLNLYDTPGLAPRMNVLFWGPGDFPVSYSNRDTLWNAWNRHSGSFMVVTGILIEQYGVTLSRMLNDIQTLDQQWLSYRSDFPPISWPLYRSWPSPNYEWFPWSMEQLQRVWLASRERLPFRTPWFRPPFWDLLMLQLLRPNSSNLPCLNSTFHIEYPLVLSRFCLLIHALLLWFQTDPKIIYSWMLTYHNLI